MGSGKKEIHHHHGDTFQMTGADGANFAPKSKNTTISSHVDKSIHLINNDQYKVINEVLDAVFEQRHGLSKEQIKQVLEVQNLLENEADNPTAHGQSKLKVAWEELKSVTGATNDGIGIATSITQNWPAITSWLAATWATIQQLA